MVKKSVAMIIMALALMPFLFSIVSALEDSQLVSFSDKTAPVSKVLEIWDRYGSIKLGTCADFPSVSKTFLSFKGSASDTQSFIDLVEIKRDADIDTIGWNDDSNWDPTTCPDCDNSKNVNFNTIAASNSRSFEEGNRTVCSRSKDLIWGNLELVNLENCCNFCVDIREPEQVEDVEQANPSKCVANYVSSSPEFTWPVVSDEGCAGIDSYEVELYLSNDTLVNTYLVSSNSFTVPSPENGEDYYIRVRAVDAAGNKGAWSSYSPDVFYDSESPKIAIESPETGSWFKESFDLEEIEEDNLALWKCEYQINAGEWKEVDCNSILEINVPEDCPDGLCVITKKAIDNACNSKETSAKYNIDTLAPVTAKEVSEPKYPGFELAGLLLDWFITDKTTITLTCTDAGKGCANTFYRINAGEWINYTAPFTVGTEDNAYLVEYYSEDLLGNVEETKNEKDKIDIMPPVSEKTESPLHIDNEENKWVGPSTNFTITAEDEEVRVKNIFYQIDESKWLVYDSPFNLENMCEDEGILHMINYYSIDHLSNEEAPKNQTVNLDCVAPAIIILNPTIEERQIQKCSQSVVAIVEDSGAGVKRVWAELWQEQENASIKVREVEMSLSVYKTYEALMDKQLPAGNYILKVMAEDNVGNINTVELKEELLNSVYVEFISPASCPINPEEGGECEFTFHVCMRGGDSIKFWLDKLGGIVTPGMMDATILKGDNSTYVGLLDNGIDAGLLDLGKGVINGRTSFSLSLSVPSDVASQIGAGAYKLDYLIKSFVQ